MLSSHDSVDLIGKNYYIFRKFRYISSLKCLGIVFQVILANHWLLLGSWGCFAVVILSHFLSPQYLKCFICTVINFNIVEDRIMPPSFKVVYVLIPKICKYVARTPCSSVGKESACKAGNHLQFGRCGFYPWVRKIPWRRKWLPTPVFLTGEFHGQRSLEGYSPRGHRVRHVSGTNTHSHIHTHRHT